MKIYSKTKFKRSTSVCFRSKTYLLFDTLINNLLKQLRTLLVPIWRNPRFDVFFYNGVSGKKYWWRVPNKIAWPVSGWGFIISLLYFAFMLTEAWPKADDLSFWADRTQNPTQNPRNHAIILNFIQFYSVLFISCQHFFPPIYASRSAYLLEVFCSCLIYRWLSTSQVSGANRWICIDRLRLEKHFITSRSAYV